MKDTLAVFAYLMFGAPNTSQQQRPTLSVKVSLMIKRPTELRVFDLSQLVYSTTIHETAIDTLHINAYHSK